MLQCGNTVLTLPFTIIIVTQIAKCNQSAIKIDLAHHK